MHRMRATMNVRRIDEGEIATRVRIRPVLDVVDEIAEARRLRSDGVGLEAVGEEAGP
jgi:hypothetical protein